VKIKYVKAEVIKNYTWLTIWLMLPDYYTFWNRLGNGDQEYLRNCWKNRKLREIDKFLESYRLSLCRGSVKFGVNKKAPNKKFSWTWFRKRVYGVWTELNTPYPNKALSSPNKNPREVPISRTNHFLTLLQIPSPHVPPTCRLKDYITLYILKRDYGNSILE
jgi:hypothetical protein